MRPNGPTETFEVTYSCGCGNVTNVRLTVQVGQTAAAIPQLSCLKCVCDQFPEPRMMTRTSPRRVESSLIARPTMVPPPNLKRGTN